MSIFGYSKYISEKYKDNFSKLAEDPIENSEFSYKDLDGDSDDSLGHPISAGAAQRYRDKIIGLYDLYLSGVKTMPLFTKVEEALKDSPELMVLTNLVDSLTVNAAQAPTLKDMFQSGVKFIDGFNDFRDKIRSTIKDKDKSDLLDDAIYRLQQRLWDNLKNVLNLHEIGSGDIPLNNRDKLSMEKILKQFPRGTWKYGPLPSPVKPKFRVVKRETAFRQLNRLEKEQKISEIRDQLGPYASDKEVMDKYEAEIALDKKEKKQKAVDKYNKSLFGRDK